MFHLLLPISWGSRCFFRQWWSRISISNNKWNHPPFPIFFPLPPSFSSLHYAGSLTLFDRMCYLQPPAAVSLSLSLHRWQLNPTAACHSEAQRKWWWCCCLTRVRGEKDRPQGTYVDVLANVVLCGMFFGTAAFQVPCSINSHHLKSYCWLCKGLFWLATALSSFLIKEMCLQVERLQVSKLTLTQDSRPFQYY